MTHQEKNEAFAFIVFALMMLAIVLYLAWYALGHAPSY